MFWKLANFIFYVWVIYCYIYSETYIYIYVYIYIENTYFTIYMVFLVAQTVKNLPAMQEIWVRSLGQEDTLEKTITTHSSFLAWRIPWTEELGGLQSTGSQSVGHDWMTNTFSFTSHICLYFLHPVIYWWMLKTLPYLGYYKQCSNKHRDAYAFSN